MCVSGLGVIITASEVLRGEKGIYCFPLIIHLDGWSSMLLSCGRLRPISDAGLVQHP